jgi:hypothetical protein
MKPHAPSRWDGIEVRGPGCIGIRHDGSCCAEWITLNDRGAGFARSFNRVAFMERATAAERAWIGGELRKKNKVCRSGRSKSANKPMASSKPE